MKRAHFNKECPSTKTLLSGDVRHWERWLKKTLWVISDQYRLRAHQAREAHIEKFGTHSRENLPWSHGKILSAYSSRLSAKERALRAFKTSPWRRTLLVLWRMLIGN